MYRYQKVHDAQTCHTYNSAPREKTRVTLNKTYIKYRWKHAEPSQEQLFFHPPQFLLLPDNHLLKLFVLSLQLLLAHTASKCEKTINNEKELYIYLQQHTVFIDLKKKCFIITVP
ncbi:hypothetical protein EVAR_70056_1 [Eumeta japonica]|uniref:Uncharacterized protein n=1 Tax=Eumeta variegata TaxID=151549 RepID=A0A4C1T5E5_EUMVA|nr:hypothetical protein EVAR_70056_1 [Eumeta japonica]